MDRNASNGTRYNNTLSDATSFMLNIQCERSRGGYVFDGLDSNGQNIPIQIKEQPIYTQANDTYYNVDDAGNHPPPPQLFICRDTYFTLNLHNGLKYYANGIPDGY
ncbi:hypothetical protein GPJ56_002781 [Histomonas meleagridis]|nr:hypothetical protein GPJ56_002781 [Histomonas meleagridis]